MPLDPGVIENLIKAGLPDAAVSVSDMRQDGRCLAASIESMAFEGKSRIEQHQMIFQLLQASLGDDLDTLAIETAVPGH